MSEQIVLMPQGSVAGVAASSSGSSKDKAAAEEESEKRKRPLLPKSSILRLLAELVRSYSVCAGLITQHVYHAGETELITEVNLNLCFLENKNLQLLADTKILL